jgi:hypothetical protein
MTRAIPAALIIPASLFITDPVAAAYDECDAVYRRCATQVGVRLQRSEAQILATCKPKLAACKRTGQWDLGGGRGVMQVK